MHEAIKHLTIAILLLRIMFGFQRRTSNSARINLGLTGRSVNCISSIIVASNPSASTAPAAGSVAGYDASGGDDCPFADGDTGHNHGAHAEPTAIPEPGIAFRHIGRLNGFHKRI